MRRGEPVSFLNLILAMIVIIMLMLVANPSFVGNAVKQAENIDGISDLNQAEKTTEVASVSQYGKTAYYYIGNQKIASVKDSEIKYYVSDHLGSSSLVVDEQGNAVSEDSYYAYGQEKESFGEEKYKYTGKELDEETGIYYYGARYYDPSVGRFLSVDPMKGSIESPQSLNRYTYTLNNPMKLVDPDGRESKFISPYTVEGYKPITRDTTVYNNYKNEYQKKTIIDAGAIVHNIMEFIGANTVAGDISPVATFNVPDKEFNNLITSLRKDKVKFLYRGDTRPPEIIFEEGFKAKGKYGSPENHVHENWDDSRYISTSTNKKEAQIFAEDGGDNFYEDFAELNLGEDEFATKGYVYYIERPNNAIKLKGENRIEIGEVLVPDEIPSSKIIGAREVISTGSLTSNLGGTKFRKYGEFSLNPNYEKM